MGPGLRVLHLLIALLSILVTIILTIRDVEKQGVKFEVRIERLPKAIQEPNFQLAKHLMRGIH